MHRYIRSANQLDTGGTKLNGEPAGWGLESIGNKTERRYPVVQEISDAFCADMSRSRTSLSTQKKVAHRSAPLVECRVNEGPLLVNA